MSILTFSSSTNLNLLVLVLFKEKSKECLCNTFSSGTFHGGKEMYLSNKVNDIGKAMCSRNCATKVW